MSANQYLPLLLPFWDLAACHPASGLLAYKGLLTAVLSHSPDVGTITHITAPAYCFTTDAPHADVVMSCGFAMQRSWRHTTRCLLLASQQIKPLLSFSQE